MAKFKFGVTTILLSAALVHCSKKGSEPSAAAPPPPPPAPATAPAEPMTPAAGTVPEGSEATSAEPAATPEPARPAPAMLSDDQIVKVLDLANTAEVEEGKYAKTKASNPKVRAFAAKMVEHHGKGKEKSLKLTTKLALKPADSPLAMQLKSDSETAMSQLKSTASTDFDRAYISAQVEEHRKVLSTIDEQLMPNVKTPELKALVQEMRTTVESHLMEAQQIQSDLASMPEKR